MRAEGFSCSLDILYAGLVIRKLRLSIKKYIKKFVAVAFSTSVINTLDADWIQIRIRFGIQPKMLDPDPESMNPDPKHWVQITLKPRCTEHMVVDNRIYIF